MWIDSSCCNSLSFANRWYPQRPDFDGCSTRPPGQLRSVPTRSGDAYPGKPHCIASKPPSQLSAGRCKAGRPCMRPASTQRRTAASSRSRPAIGATHLSNKGNAVSQTEGAERISIAGQICPRANHGTAAARLRSVARQTKKPRRSGKPPAAEREAACDFGQQCCFVACVPENCNDALARVAWQTCELAGQIEWEAGAVIVSKRKEVNVGDERLKVK